MQTAAAGEFASKVFPGSANVCNTSKLYCANAARPNKTRNKVATQKPPLALRNKLRHPRHPDTMKSIYPSCQFRRKKQGNSGQGLFTHLRARILSTFSDATDTVSKRLQLVRIP